jgi:hypothetical protein
MVEVVWSFVHIFCFLARIHICLLDFYMISHIRSYICGVDW